MYLSFCLCVLLRKYYLSLCFSAFSTTPWVYFLVCTDWCWSWNSNTLATWCKDLTHLKRPWYWERLRAGGEGDDRGWDGWMASQTQWTLVWVDSGSWWWTGRPGVLHSMGYQRVEHNWATELNKEPGGLQSMGSKKVRHDWVANTTTTDSFNLSLPLDKQDCFL